MSQIIPSTDISGSIEMSEHLYALIAEAEEQIADGAELIDVDEVFSKLRVKYAA